ncbi:sigma factor-like helix-turn-helix DNA-binding protein, partial [Mycolicibacterium sphagni]|uniref:sigma factor-like helix-turn-helix DNA-binding protein n=1 Tax=Mycolicibacterium sphagni TaxID=1786 RepID=UPI0039763B67
MHARRKRFEPVDPEQSVELTNQFFLAAATGDMDQLMEMLAPDVVWTADSAGKVSAARRPVVGAAKVAKLVMGLSRLGGKDAAADVVLAESVSMAMMVVLETLTPDERAVFVLREVFGFEHNEIASAVGKSAAA